MTFLCNARQLFSSLMLGRCSAHSRSGLHTAESSGCLLSSGDAAALICKVLARGDVRGLAI
jgi:hypothetical protein